MFFSRTICHRLKYILTFSSFREKVSQKGFHNTPTFNSNFNSSLYFSSSEDVYSVLLPAFDRTYLQSVADNLESIHQCLRVRGVDTSNIAFEDMKSNLLKFSELNDTIEKIKKKRNKLLSKKRKIQSINDDATKVSAKNILDKQHEELKESLLQARTSFYYVEKIVVPFLLKIPAQIREDMTDSVQVIDRFEGSASAFKEQNQQFPALNYIRLGYINNIYHSSIVGPDAQYLIGDGAQAFHSLVNFLGDRFEAAHYVPIGGLDMVKSALIEAVNDKEVSKDLFTIRDKDCEAGQQHHLVGEASLEAFCAWLVKSPDNEVISPRRYLQVGSHYGSSFSQTHALRGTILCDEAVSNQSMEQLYSNWWSALTALGLRCQSLRVDVQSLRASEHAKYELQAWLHSKGQFVPAGHVTHYGSYLSTRLGLPQHQKKHILSSSVDILQLLKCLFEHYQDPSTGKIMYPQSLRDYFFI